MKIPPKEIRSAWETFVQEKISDSDILDIQLEVSSYSDLLAKIIIDTDFLERFSEIKQVILGYAPKVSRSLLNESPDTILKSGSLRINKIKLELFEQQREYARRVADLNILEREIISKKNLLKSINNSTI